MFYRRFLILVFLISYTNEIFTQSYSDSLFTSYFQQDGPGWIASDGTISLALPDGRTMWFMGDSHVDQVINAEGEIPCLFNTRNCILVQDDNDLSLMETYYNSNGSDLYEKQFIQMPGDSAVTYWPGDAIIKEDTVYSFWSRYVPDTSDIFGIKFESMVVAKIKLPEIELIDVQPIQYPEWEYGMSIIWDEEDNYYYIYGKILDWVVFKPILARATIDNILGPWEFYDGVGWTNSIASSAFIAEEASAAFSVFYLNEEYHLFYQENGFLQCGLGRDMYIVSSENPWGPFENKTLVYTMEDQFDGNYPLTYNGEAHPQFIQNDELLVSYNVNRLCPNECQTDPFTSTYDPDQYRPKFARIPICSFAKDLEDPEILCNDVMVDADSTGNFNISNTDFDPIMVSDNCNISQLTNNINNLPSLEGVTLPIGSTMITWTVADSSGNSSECSFEFFVNELTSYDILENQSTVSVFPNPAKDKIFIHNNSNNIILRYSLFNLSGQKINIETQTSANVIDVSSLDTGVYFLRVDLNDSYQFHKIIVL